LSQLIFLKFLSVVIGDHTMIAVGSVG